MTNSEPRLDRRAFLTTTGALLVSLSAPAAWTEAAASGAATRPPVKGDQLDSYITIDADGTVVAYYGKIDGGQGLGTSIAQMVAEEIDVPYEKVRVVMGDSALTMDMGGASAAARAISPASAETATSTGQSSTSFVSSLINPASTLKIKGAATIARTVPIEHIRPASSKN
jgi:CO/xanthine dehydrogenase Mo-binding subunit